MPCGEAPHPLFRVNPGVPLREALEQVSQLLFQAKHLARQAALERDDRYTGSAHCFSEMGKAVVGRSVPGLLTLHAALPATSHATSVSAGSISNCRCCSGRAASKLSAWAVAHMRR